MQEGSLFSTPSPAFFFKFIYLLIFGCIGSPLLRTGLSPVAASEGHSLWCTGFSPWRPPLLRSTGSRRTGLSTCGWQALEHRLSSCGPRAPELRLSSCGARAQLLRGTRNPPGPGPKPPFPAPAGRLPTTAPPGKSAFFFLIYLFLAVLGLRCGEWASHCGGLSCFRAQATGAWASVVMSCGLSSCGSQAQ